MLGRRVLPVKICSCPKRDMEREENDTRLQKNHVFRRNKKCISQDNQLCNSKLNNHHHHSNDSDMPPCKMIKTESENTNNNVYSLSVSDYFL